jgi:hypothetical protein
MRTFDFLLAAVLFLAGLVFALQGFNVLPGSPMTGSLLWGIIGSLMVVTGLVLLVLASRRRPR